ncbi:hypothetical protein TRVL_09295 [Trypanosoma vivax]|nr:hypothetical protein TRVL_09295 [Trypanosoma vivax]
MRACRDVLAAHGVRAPTQHGGGAVLSPGRSADETACSHLLEWGFCEVVRRSALSRVVPLRASLSSCGTAGETRSQDRVVCSAQFLTSDCVLLLLFPVPPLFVLVRSFIYDKSPCNSSVAARSDMRGVLL